jgi:hypothetical protein
MAFYRVKKIKGLPYLYREERYRKGDKVYSKSSYVGALADIGAGGSNTGALAKEEEKERIKEIITEIKKRMSPINFRLEVRDETIARRYKVSNILKDTLKNHDTVDKYIKKTIPEPKTNKSYKKQKAPISLVTKFNLRENKISEIAIRKEQAQLYKSLKKSGLDTKKFQKIELEKYGKKSGYRKNVLSKGYTVYLPEGKSKSIGKFKTSCRKAMAGASLDLLKEQKPEQYKTLQNFFKSSHIETLNNVRHYVRACGGKDKEKTVKEVTQGKFPKPGRSSLKPYSLGLVDYEQRGDWRDDAIATFSEVIGKGYSKSISDRQNELGKAERLAEKASTTIETHKGFVGRFNIERQQAEKELKKANARIALQQESLNKIRTLRGIFKKGGL